MYAPIFVTFVSGFRNVGSAAADYGNSSAGWRSWNPVAPRNPESASSSDPRRRRKLWQRSRDVLLFKVSFFFSSTRCCEKNSLPTSINRALREDIFLIVRVQEDGFLTTQFEDNSKLRFPCSVSIPLTGMSVFRSSEVVDKDNVVTVSADQNTHILINGRITDHGKPRTGRLRNRLLELDG